MGTVGLRCSFAMRRKKWIQAHTQEERGSERAMGKHLERTRERKKETKKKPCTSPRTLNSYVTPKREKSLSQSVPMNPLWRKQWLLHVRAPIHKKLETGLVSALKRYNFPILSVICSFRSYFIILFFFSYFVCVCLAHIYHNSDVFSGNDGNSGRLFQIECTQS